MRLWQRLNLSLKIGGRGKKKRVLTTLGPDCV